jgi:hypothetical protein
MAFLVVQHATINPAEAARLKISSRTSNYKLFFAHNASNKLQKYRQDQNICAILVKNPIKIASIVLLVIKKVATNASR